MICFLAIRLIMNGIMGKHAFCTWESKGADQLHGSCSTDQHLCFCFIDSTIPVLPKSEIQASSCLLWWYSPVFVGPGWKP